MVGRKTIRIAGRDIGKGCPCFIIAEAGVNHNGSLDMALELIEAAFQAGADAVKFQTFKAKNLVSQSAPKVSYQKAHTAADETMFELLKKLELSEKAHHVAMEYCDKKGILFLSTLFDEQSVDFLHNLGVVAFKIPSGEITNLPLLEHVAHKNKPIILSTGMSNLDEVDKAVNTLYAAGAEQLVLLHCITSYPADPEDVNLLAMKTMYDVFSLPVGFSDHTLGDSVALAAVSLGACIVEKHFTLDRKLPGPDHPASLEPAELKKMISAIRIIERAFGDGIKRPAQSELENAFSVRKSLVAIRSIQAGEVIERSMIGSRRPAGGLEPALLQTLIGKKATQDIPEGVFVKKEMFE